EPDPHVLYVSTHQYPFYPGTGAVDEVGVGPGSGFTVNVPLEAGSVNEDYKTAFAEVALPVLRQFKPDLLMVSAGCGADEREHAAHDRRLYGDDPGTARRGGRVLQRAHGLRHGRRLRPQGVERVARRPRRRAVGAARDRRVAGERHSIEPRPAIGRRREARAQ